ncbi:MAG: type III-B CRISPR-associated protein Cas10/Cmr2 [Sulfurovum sp.]
MKYIALTIGPIYKTLQNAKKTRELWGGSYIFSYIMKEIIRPFKDREFIVPYVKDETLFDTGKGVGLFHDRFIFEAPNDTKESVESRVDEVLLKLSKDSKIDIDFLKK